MNLLKALFFKYRQSVMSDNKLGGVGKCKYCGKITENVAFHESNMCEKNPNGLQGDKYIFKKIEESHFEPLDPLKICDYPEHNPPMHLYIPAGQKYIHVCPSCGNRIEIFNPIMF